MLYVYLYCTKHCTTYVRIYFNKTVHGLRAGLRVGCARDCVWVAKLEACICVRVCVCIICIVPGSGLIGLSRQYFLAGRRNFWKIYLKK